MTDPSGEWIIEYDEATDGPVTVTVYPKHDEVLIEWMDVSDYRGLTPRSLVMPLSVMRAIAARVEATQ